MKLPDWIDNTISALYGQRSNAESSNDASYSPVLSYYADHMWPIILDRFRGTPRQRPIIVPVNSPAGSPTTLADSGTEVLVFDTHLYHLFMALAIMSSSQVKADVFVPAIASIYAERVFSTGDIETAALMEAGSRLAVLSSPPITLSENEYLNIEKTGRVQLAFVVAHELAHLAFSEYPDRVTEDMEEHRRLVREVIKLKAPGTAELRDAEPARARMRQLGYDASARSRFLDRRIETEKPLGALRAWDLISSDNEFMVEVLADHMALVALLRSHRRDYLPDFLASAAASAVSNLSVLQYLDELTSGHHPGSLAMQPEAGHWQAALRGVALNQSLAMAAIYYERQGELNYNEESLLRMVGAAHDVSRRTNDYMISPLSWSIDFAALKRTYAADKAIALAASEFGRASEDVRRFLRFNPPTGDALFTKYVNVRIIREEDQRKINIWQYHDVRPHFEAIQFEPTAMAEAPVGDQVASLEEELRALEEELRATAAGRFKDRLRLHSALGSAFARLGQFDRALDNASEEIRLRLRIQGRDHPETLRTRYKIALWTGQRGHHAEALYLAKQLLSDTVRVLGPDDPHVLETRHIIIRWTAESENAREALHLARELLRDQERVLGPDDPETMITRDEIVMFAEQCDGANGDDAAGATASC